MAKPQEFKKSEHEFDQSIIDLARVTRVMKGGKRLRFRVCMVIGDKKGKVGYAVAKGTDVAGAVNKAVTKAKKHMITVPMINETIPHDVEAKYSAAMVLMKAAPAGTGVIAGGAMRTILELAGVGNVVAKNLGRTNNKVSIVKATFKAIEQLVPASKPKSGGSVNKESSSKKAKEKAAA
ncbi:MAG: 30S ribosomal protein S5 [Candidatus Buchananbacteria bacterium CG10_big_fil_rev_8_21_14_0_10_42_9]|uniref:Small ribosomal subunit protein uS5 n=1 Tax=Candidatus Buchananbacteria bacterium CG10_big_fil_rev_8_21_14_0_10_42_9 TaxID=1974526 RepID=A0A2H0W226_9BACT|nr:MAG: 30S ribosomal protein S5 [Candidatus Buchananbacteria bacterium CG10_big_fil_rev_8_21_14_0_10_42_9]